MRRDIDNMRGMKSYLSAAELGVLALMARSGKQWTNPQIQAALPDVLAPRYRQGVGKMLRGLLARGYVERTEAERTTEGGWIWYRVTPEGRRMTRRLLRGIMGVAGIETTSHVLVRKKEVA